MKKYAGQEIHPPQDWMDQCKALIPNEDVWVLLDDWPWLEAWDTGMPPIYAVRCALLDVLAPEVGAAYTPGEAKR